MPKKITDDELLARVDQELRSAQDYMGGKLSTQRRKALMYYMGQAEGDLAPPEVEGRSTYVSTDVADTIEWMLPSLLRIFTASDRVVQLNPRKPGMEQTAEDATDYLNWIFTTQNNGFQCLHTMFKDALLSKSGILKVWWDDHIDEAREEYRGLSDTELVQLLEDEEVEPIEHESRPDEQAEKEKQRALEQMQQQFGQAQQAAQQGNPQAQQAVQGMAQQMQALMAQPPVMVHDVTVKRSRKAAQVKIDPVPPEEFFISRNTKRIQDTPFVAHVVERAVSDLRAQGYSISDDELAAGDESGMVGRSQERTQRWSYDDSTAPFPNMIEPPSDPSMRLVWVCEAYLRADVNGDGIAEWRKILKVGSKILDNEECDGPPFVLITPIPMPHRLIGLSIADQAMPVQYQKTALIRAMQDNLYLQVNGRYFAVDGQVNLDDLLTSRPGGVVRVKNPNAVGPLNQGMADMRDSYQLLEFMETQKEDRTGWSRQSTGPGENVINRTATEVATTTNRADMRTELIARVFAETGVKDLFVLILKLVCQYQDQKAQFNLNGRWLEVNPREWRHQFDVVVNVGLGTNDPAQKMQQIGTLMQMQERLHPLGLVAPQEVYNAAAEMVKAIGFKDSGRFLKDPKESPPPPPPPNPEMLKIQADQQRQQAELQIKMQMDAVQKQHEKELAQFKAQQDMLVENNRQQMQAAQVAQQNEIQAQRETLAAQNQAQIEQMRIAMDERIAQMKEEVNLQVAQIGAQSRIMVAEISAASKGGNDSGGDTGATGGASTGQRQAETIHIKNELHLPESPIPIVNVRNEVPQQASPTVHVTNEVKPAPVVIPKRKTETFVTRDGMGNMTGATQVESDAEGPQ